MDTFWFFSVKLGDIYLCFHPCDPGTNAAQICKWSGIELGICPMSPQQTGSIWGCQRCLCRGPWNAAKTVFSEGGLPSLWRGSGPTVIRLSIGAGLHFFLLDWMKESFVRINKGAEISSAQNVAIGGNLKTRWCISCPNQQNSVGWTHKACQVVEFGDCNIFTSILVLSVLQMIHRGCVLSRLGLSRAMTTTLLCPITVVKTRMEYSQVGYKSTVDALVVISQREGVRGLFKGLAPTVLTSAPFSAFHYTFYRKLQELVQGSTNPSMATNFFCGTLAAMGATVLTHPGDVVRTRTQLGFGSLGALNTLKMIVETQGISGLMTGEILINLQTSHYARM